MPLVVRITLAPASRILAMRSLVMSISRWRIRSTSFMSCTTTCLVWAHKMERASEGQPMRLIERRDSEYIYVHASNLYHVMPTGES